MTSSDRVTRPTPRVCRPGAVHAASSHRRRGVWGIAGISIEDSKATETAPTSRGSLGCRLLPTGHWRDTDMCRTTARARWTRKLRPARPLQPGNWDDAGSSCRGEGQGARATCAAGERVVVNNWINALKSLKPARCWRGKGIRQNAISFAWRSSSPRSPLVPHGRRVSSVRSSGAMRPAAFYETTEEAMADHWGNVPRSYEEWGERQARSNFDPSVWFLVRHRRSGARSYAVFPMV